VRFALSSDQEALRDAARDLLGAEVDAARLRGIAAGHSGVDDELWRRAREQGWLGLAVDPARGGLGLGTVAQAVVAEALGHACGAIPFTATAGWALPALEAAGADCEVGDVLSRGLRVVVGSDHGLVADARGAHAFLLIVGGDARWYVGDAVEVLPRVSLDRTRRLAEVRACAAGTLVGPAALAEAAHEIERVLRGAELVGGMQRLLDLTVDYARHRVQFGRPIGSFQAIKHKLADMLVRVECARSVVYHAAWAREADAPDARYLAAVVATYCAAAARFVAGEALQVHGATGYTWESDVHFWYERTLTDAALLGSTPEEIRRLLSLDPLASGFVP
jgi:alkylation response protein AidB-like acyl-CoA dehydrogenase